MNIQVSPLFLILFITTTVCGCRQDHNQEVEDHGHSHNETLQLFATNQNFEVFAESSPFVVGQPCQILAHFSHIENFKPLENGVVTVSLLVGEGGEIVSQTLEEQERRGIYHFSIKPQKAGSAQLIFEIKTSSGISQVVLPDIIVYSGVHRAHEEAAKLAITSTNAITFTKEQSWKVEFATDEARYEPFGQVIHTTAQILPTQGDERIVSAKAAGLVIFSNEKVVEGRGVAAGQTLFTIDGSLTADNNLAVRYAEAESEYIRAKAELERKSELAAEGIVSQAEMIVVQTIFAQARANYNNLKQNFSAGHQSVASPIAGFITKLSVVNGEYVEAGQPLLVVSQNRNLLIKAEVQPKYFELLGNVVSANIRVMNSNRIYTLEELEGRVLSYGKSIDLQNPLIPVVFQVNNKAGLLSGSFVELYIKTISHTHALTIPNGALTEEMGNFFVFVQLTPELFEKRWVKKGGTDGLRTQILEGVALGERVVSKGAVMVKLSQSSGSLDPHAGHVH